MGESRCDQLRMSKKSRVEIYREGVLWIGLKGNYPMQTTEEILGQKGRDRDRVTNINRRMRDLTLVILPSVNQHTRINSSIEIMNKSGCGPSYPQTILRKLICSHKETRTL